jgi:hypothetical protein
MGDFIKIAKKYLSAGITTIPVGADKQPRVNWTKYQKKHITNKEIEKYFGDCFGIAVLTGGLNGIECIDIDTKYDLSGDLAERYKLNCNKNILNKLWVQQTRSGGYHWIYKTDIHEPNQKLASRKTTPYEKHATYMENFSNEGTKEIAANVASGDKSRVLIETRGGEMKNGEPASKGYFLVAPTPSYKKLFGSLTKLTDDERNHLITEARKFNEYTVNVRNYKRDKVNREGESPFEKYNNNGDVLGLLLNHGWSVVSQTGNYVRLRRPGNPESKSSALLDLGTRIFNIFSTSCVLEPGKGYTPSDLFIELGADGDTMEAYKLLKELGY